MVRTSDKAELNLKRLEKLMAELRKSWIFVEGKRDREALGALGCRNVLTISGNLRLSCNVMMGKTDKVVVLTDLDRRGNELAVTARSELESRSITVDLETRKKLAGILKLRYFEDVERKYHEFMEKLKELRLKGE